MTFTRQDVLEAARMVVADKGEGYVYEKFSCSYADNGEPSCFVGHVVYILDKEAFARLAKVEEELGTESVKYLMGGDDYLPVGFWTTAASDFLAIVQDQQDGRETYGYALATAEDKA